MRARILGGLIGALAALAASALPARANEPGAWNAHVHGIYIGGMLTYSWIDQSIREDLTTINPIGTRTGSAHQDGLGATIILGYRHPLADRRLVLGVEVDGTIGENRGTFSSRRYIADWLLTVRGIAGTHITPNVFWFLTAGGAWLGESSKPTVRGVAGVGGVNPAQNFTHSTTIGGYVVGTGVEVNTGMGFLVRSDYLYMGFEDWQYTIQNTTNDYKIATNAHQFRIGVVIPLHNPYEYDDHRYYK